MRFQSKIIFGAILLTFSESAMGQAKLRGEFIRTENLEASTTYEILTIKNDSIWFSRKKVGKDVPQGQKFQNWAGTAKYYKSGFNNGPFYHGSLFVMSCDTCPQFWKYTTNRRDRLNINTHVWTLGKTDTIIKNGDTSYTTPQIIETEDPADINRMREIIFTITDGGDILIDKNIYRKKRSKQ